MECTQKVTDAITCVGSSDRRLALFENLFPLENGITYNAYLIEDEHIALIDLVDIAITRQFMENLEAALAGRKLDYLVVNHMEPDHCANIDEICRRYPDIKIVGTDKTMQFIGQFFEVDIMPRAQIVKEGDTLSLGKHTLRFYMAPMVHWPEVMFTFETSQNILFSADAFGTFGGYNGNLFSDEMDYEALYLDEARRYYTNIVGKFGPQVKAALAKFAGQDISLVCPLHGPVLRGEMIGFMMEKYGRWSTYTPEENGVLIAYGSMYGHTENAAHLLSRLLADRGVSDIRMFDVSKTHFSEIIAQAFRHSHIVLASPTYNMHLYLPMATVMQDMLDLNLQNRKFALLANGSWAPAAHKIMEQKVQEMKNCELLAPPLLLRSALKKEQLPELEALADTIAASVKAQG